MLFLWFIAELSRHYFLPGGVHADGQIV